MLNPKPYTLTSCAESQGEEDIMQKDMPISDGMSIYDGRSISEPES
jgi:hypothetical protein